MTPIQTKQWSRRDWLRLAALGTLGTAGALASGRLVPSHAAEPPLIIDGHLDFGWNAVCFGRDLTSSAYILRAQAAGKAVERVAGRAMVGLPELLAGRVGLAFGVVFVIPRHLMSSGLQIANYASPAEANHWGWQMVAAIQDLAVRSSQFALVRTQSDLDLVLNSWRPDAPPESRKVGILLSMEGAEPVSSPQELTRWYESGLCCLSLAWGATRYAGSNLEPGGLTGLGVELLAAMKPLNIILDTAHLAERAFWQVNDIWQGELVYTHGVPRYYFQSQRALTDDQIKTIAARDGAIGIGLYNGFYQLHRAQKGRPTVTDVTNAIDYVCQLTGDSAHVAIGSDLDGGFGAENGPTGVNTIADLQLLPDALRARSYADAQIEQIMHGNWLRILRRALPA